MAWNDRLREAAYTSPVSNTRFTFDYENVSRSVDKRTTAFEFPDANGTFVQDLGHSGRRYPLRVFFWGDDYDQECNNFENALLEIGTGKLEHPIYGTVDVVPFGTITRRDDLKTAANQAVIEVLFFSTINIIYPSSQIDPTSTILNSINQFNEAMAGEFETNVNFEGVTNRASLRNTYENLLNNFSQGLEGIANTQDNVRVQFNAILDSIDSSISTLIGDPLTLAFQTTLLIQSPARAKTSIEARIDAYNNLLQSIIIGPDAIEQPGLNPIHSFHTNDLYASSYITGMIVSAINNQFEIKTNAVGVAEIILNEFENVTAWRDDNFASLSEVDTGASYQQLQEAVALTAGFLVQISFSLKQERKLILDRAHTIIDLSAELYGNVDDEQLNFMISSNDLSGSEHLEIPRGREIVYYV